jgi:hypothetical protein
VQVAERAAGVRNGDPATDLRRDLHLVDARVEEFELEVNIGTLFGESVEVRLHLKYAHEAAARLPVAGSEMVPAAGALFLFYFLAAAVPGLHVDDENR